jgi:hypothetical protein
MAVGTPDVRAATLELLAVYARVAADAHAAAGGPDFHDHITGAMEGRQREINEKHDVLLEAMRRDVAPEARDGPADER